jgi:hypothetical protein
MYSSAAEPVLRGRRSPRTDLLAHGLRSLGASTAIVSTIIDKTVDVEVK